MTKLVLKEGGFYINRKGEKVGPLESDTYWVGTNCEWVCVGTGKCWGTDGQEFNAYETDEDLIEEWKEEPVNKFNIGDKVKVTTPQIVYDTFKGQVGVVSHILSSFCEEQVVVIDYGNSYQQTAYVSQDGVVLVEESKEPQETPQEDDEWGPWTEDWEGYVGDYSHKIVDFIEGGIYFRHKVKKPIVKKQIEVGGSYVTKSEGLVYKCIYIEGDKVWMKASTTGPAYVWTLDGKSISLNETWDIDFSQDPKDQVSF